MVMKRKTYKKSNKKSRKYKKNKRISKKKRGGLPRIERGDWPPDNNNLVKNIEDLIVGNSYQVVHWYDIEEEDSANFYGHYRDNVIATLLRIDGFKLYFENITPKGDAEEGRDYYTWDNNTDLGIYNIGLPREEGPLLKGGKRRKK